MNQLVISLQNALRHVQTNENPQGPTVEREILKALAVLKQVPLRNLMAIISKLNKDDSSTSEEVYGESLINRANTLLRELEISAENQKKEIQLLEEKIKISKLKAEQHQADLSKAETTLRGIIDTNEKVIKLREAHRQEIKVISSELSYPQLVEVDAQHNEQRLNEITENLDLLLTEADEILSNRIRLRHKKIKDIRKRISQSASLVK